MSMKRGRPLSYTNNEVVRRRRQLTTERTRQYRERQRREQAAAAVPPTEEQLQQGEHIINFDFTDIDAAETLSQLGLRVQGVALAQDVEGARAQDRADPVDEHNNLYREGHPQPTSSQRRLHPPGHWRSTAAKAGNGSSSISHFFPSLPAQNPFASTSGQSVTPYPTTVSAAPSLRPCLALADDTFDFRIDDDDLPVLADPTHDDLDDEDERQEAQEQEGVRLNNGEEVIDHEAEQTMVDDHGEEVIDNEEVVVDAHHSDGETSEYAFASEHSFHTAEAEDVAEEISTLDHTVQKLYEQFQGGHHGCSVEQHEEQFLQHHQEVSAHHRLNDIFNDPTFPSVLALPDMVSAERLARQPAPTPAQWQAMFCGVHPEPLHEQQDPIRPRHVCLHAEESQAVEAQVAFDIDSLLGFASSLAMARQGLWYQPAPQMRQNMSSDNHLETTMFRDGHDPEQAPRASLALLRDVPHFLLGRVEGAHDITVHVLFPHLAVTPDRFVSLTKEQLSRWLDRIFMPAIHRHYPAHYTQHLPATYQHALANSRARQVEERQVETASYQSQQSLGYHLQPEHLDLIWADVRDTIRHTPGLADFRDLQLFFSAKGTKLQFKTSPSRPTLLDTMENFQSYFERIVDLDLVYLDRFYVDLGKEICPRVSLLASQHGHVGQEAQVYSWKRCCLEEYMRWMYDGAPPRGRGQRYYHQNMLYDACSLTSVTPKTSTLRGGGLIYSQFYASVKEVWDAAKCKPFQNDGLEEMALDPQIRQGARNALGGRRKDVKVLERAYCARKCRAHHALQASRQKSFGIREEHRVSWPLFQALMNRLRLEEREDLEVVMFDCPSYAWPVTTNSYLHFLWRSADKFATGFEVVLARCRSEFVTWEQTKMMAMFLRALRFVLGGHQLDRESALWWSRRERTAGDPPRHRVWYGLGFSNTLPRYRYCWLEPRFDWNHLRFRSDVTDEVLFGNRTLRGQYLRRGQHAQGFLDISRQMELALEWMDQHAGNSTIRDRLILWLVHICLHQFRLDVLTSIRPEIADEHREAALEGRTPFCHEYFEEIMNEPVYLLSGNKCDFKQASDLGDFLFGYGDGRIRSHWEDRPFRKLYRRAKTALGLRHHASRLGGTFTRRFLRHLFAYHWVLPYPSASGLLQTTKQGQRMWYSIELVPDMVGALDLVDTAAWQWARKSWKGGRPRALPEFTRWEKGEWEGWIEQQVGT